MSIHLKTWSKAHAMTEQQPYMLGNIQLHRNVVKAEFIEALNDHPMWIAHLHMKSLGFKLARSMYRQTSHYVSYMHSEDNRWGTIYRHGGGSITTPLYTEGSKVFIRNETERF